MDITDNKYIRYVFDELAKVPGHRYSSMLYRKLYFDTAMPQHEKDRIKMAIVLLKMNGYVEEKEGGTPVMNLVLATEDKGNKVIEYGKRVEIAIDLQELMPYVEDRLNYDKILYELTGDEESFFPASNKTVKESISEAGMLLPRTLTSRIDIYEYVVQKAGKPVYEKFLKVLSEKIEDQGNDVVNMSLPIQSPTSSVTNVTISNPIVIENMKDSKIKTTDKSHATNVTILGNDNQVVSNSKNAKISNEKDTKPKLYWLQILYWLFGIVLAIIGIYKFFIE